MTSAAEAKPASAWRRVGAMLYDTVLVLSLLFFATAAAVALNDGKAIEPGNALYAAYLLAVAYFYFGWSWTRGGQTLGMKAWKIRVRDVGGGCVGWGQTAIRLVAAGGGISLLGMLGADGLAWHDRLSRSTVVEVPAGTSS